MKALIVVDYQNDFVDGALGFPGAEKLEPIILRKIAECREKSDVVIFTLDTHGENYLETSEGRKLPIPHCIKGTRGHELYGELRRAVQEGDVVIEKPAFGSLELADYLKRLSPDEIELCGLVTDICVISNAIIAKAAAPEADVIVDSRACACGDHCSHENALRVMSGLQITVI